MSYQSKYFQSGKQKEIERKKPVQVERVKIGTVTTTPSAAEVDGVEGKTFLQKLGDILNFSQNMDTANSAMAFGALTGNKDLQQTGVNLAKDAEQNMLDSSEEFQYITERGAGGAAKGVEGFVNALGYLGQMQNRFQTQQNSDTFAAWSALTGNKGFAEEAERTRNYIAEQEKEGLKDTVSFGSKYQQNIQDRYADADITKAGQVVANVSEGVGGLLPSVAANVALPGSGLAVSALSAGGNAAQEAKASGASDSQALAYGAVVGGIEAATEKIFDGVAGIFGKGAADDVVDSIAKKLAKNETAQTAFVKIANSLGEGFEEFISEFGQRVANELIIDSDNRSFKETLGDAWTSAIMGAVVGGVVQTAGGIVQGIKGDPSALAQQAADAAVEQIKAETSAKAENRPAETRPDVRATPTLSEQKTAPSAVESAEMASAKIGADSGEAESVGAAPAENTVGAKEARFRYQEAPTQSVADNLFSEQELLNYDLRNKHQVYTDAEANELANVLLDQDYEGEVARMKDPDTVWGKTENIEGHRVLENLVEKARKSGSEEDWAEVKAWKELYDRKGGTEAAQTLQGRAQFANSTAEIVSEAAEVLDSPNTKKLRPQQKAQLLDEVYNQAEAYNNIAEGDTDSLIALIERNNEIRKTTGFFTKKTAKQMDWALHQVVEKFPSTSEQFLRDVAAAQIRNIASDYRKVGVTESAKSVRIMNMLSKFSTVVRNLVSNNVFDPLESLSNNVGLIADSIMSLATGKRTVVADPSWFSKAKRQGSLEGALKSYIEVGLDAQTADAASKYEGVGSGRTFKMVGNPLERLLSTWSKYESYALQTTDELQKGGIRAETQRQIGQLKAKGKLGEDALQGWAEETARQRTFQNDGAVSKAMTGARNALNHLHVGDIGAGDILLPFARVPGNLAAQSANYSPVGFINSMRQMVEVMIDGKSGRLTEEAQAQAARNFGRGITGTSLLAGFGALAAAGLIDVAGADDKDKEAMEKSQGKTGTQWNLSATLRALNGGSAEWKDGDTLVSIGFLDPLNSIMAAGSLLAEDIKENGFTLVGASKASLGGVWQAILDLPAMTSISSLIDSYKYAEGERDVDKALNALVDYAGSQAASFVVPNFLRGIATGTDDTVRNQYAGENPAQTTLDSVKSGIPGLRQTLPASLDPFGKEKTYTGNAVLDFLNANILPGSVTKYDETKVQKVLEELYSATNNASIYPDKNAPSSISVKNVKYPLNAEQKDEYMRVAGNTVEDIMNNLLKTKAHKKSTKVEQAEHFAVANEYARAVAKREVTSGKYELSGTAKSIQKAIDAGIPAADFIPYYADKSDYDTDKNGAYTAAENIKAIEASGLKGEKRIALYMVTFPSWVEGASKRGVDFSDYMDYKIATNGASKKADKIAALVSAGYTRDQAEQMYKSMD